MTPAELRALGKSYPRALRPEVIARAIPQIERFLPAGDDPLVPFADDEPVPVGFRFPSPRGIVHVLDHGDFELTLPGIEAAFFGDLATSFDYPWVRELGVVALLDPLSLSPYKVRARAGWLVCDGAQVVPRRDAVFVPERAMAERLATGMSRDDALDAMGQKEHAEATAALRAKNEQYLAELQRLDARCRELRGEHAFHPDGTRERLRAMGLALDDLDRPAFELTRAQREALLR